tara:strand:+ start:299 stop:643 length:345 start_codon:yes stop_codon:yes gene_type:complete
MKKLSLYVFLVLMWCNASVAEELYCKVEKAFRCDAESCKEFKSQIFINLDTDRKIYQRGDSKGVDTHDMNFYQSGIYRLAEIDEGSFLKIDPENSFVEVFHLGLVTVNNFGKCK